jgi:DNA (cytosine-5)-methyltransferase 1
MSKLRVLDLFSGIGGFSLGLERTSGFETVAFCEIDPYCRDVLRKHWPDVPCADDVTTREFKEGEADVVCGGFPCQDISFAGRGAGLAGARSGLYRELIRAIRVVRPLHAILENVAALLGRGLGTVLGDLAEIGYDAEWHCIPASAVGAPHRRDRIWIVADAGRPERWPLSGFYRELVRNRTISDPLWQEGTDWPGTGRQAMADADDQRQPQPSGAIGEERGWFGDMGAPLAHTASSGQRADGRPQGQAGHADIGGEDSRGDGNWFVEPDVGRVAYGVPSRVDRLRSLGNAVVPQIPELIGNTILAARAAA